MAKHNETLRSDWVLPSFCRGLELSWLDFHRDARGEGVVPTDEEQAEPRAAAAQAPSSLAPPSPRFFPLRIVNTVASP
jgi:hypothetical protein